MSELKARRMAKGLTQEELAHRVGVKKNTIARYEIGVRHPRADTLVLLARELDCEAEDLIREQFERARTDLIARGAIGDAALAHSHSK